MIARLFKILGLLAGATLGLAFAVGSLFGLVLRRMAAAFLSAWRDNRVKPPDTKVDARAGMKKGILRTVLGIAVAGALAGALVFVSGIIPIKASSRHWPITQWILHTGMERSVATHSLGIEVPPLDDPDLVLKGAGHYEIGCRPCHGSPGLPHPRIAHMMTPLPPYLPPTIGKWKPEELFYIVKH